MGALSRGLAAALLLAGAGVTLSSFADSPSAEPRAATTPASTPTPTPSSPTKSPATSPQTPASAGTTKPSETATPTGGACAPGVPVRLVIPALGVDAPFERIGLDTSAEPDASGKYPIGNPANRDNAGWYAQGPQPGAGHGTILANGHTYRDGSAIFTEDFAKRIAVGQRIDIIQDNGTTCSYAVQRAWREVDADRDYPRIVTDEKLYDFTGPERLFLATCGGSWNAASQNYDDISMLVATPIGRSAG